MRSLSCVILLAGCTALEPPAAPVQAPAPPAHFQDHWSPAEQANERQAWAHPDQVPMGQMPRRLEVEHLRQSILDCSVGFNGRTATRPDVGCPEPNAG